MPYIHFTDEQKQRAASVDLVEFLRRQGEKLVRSGPEYRLASDHSITVRGSEWYDHAIEHGGGPVSFVRNYYGLTYPEAVTRLLDGEQGSVIERPAKQEEPEKKEFALPNVHTDMRRVYAYLLQRRLIDREVLSVFARAGLVYESCEKSKDGLKEYHNAVFVGKDEHGIARHAHKRSLNSGGNSLRINVEGCDPRYSFHYIGTSDRLYVFEAPIDLLSFISLYPKDWQAHSYVALCGTSRHALMWMLEQNENLNKIVLCMDHDETGIEVNGRLAETLREAGYIDVSMLQPRYKDWNEDLKAGHGLEAQAPVEHPQLETAPGICRRIGKLSESAKLDTIQQVLPWLLEKYRSHLHWGRFDHAMTCMEQMSALSLAAYGRERRQIGDSVSSEEMTKALCRRIQPHQNRSVIKSRDTEIAMEIQSVLAKGSAEGIRTDADKQQLADAWLGLAVSCAKIPVKYEADLIKQQQKQEREQTEGMAMSQEQQAPSAMSMAQQMM